MGYFNDFDFRMDGRRIPDASIGYDPVLSAVRGRPWLDGQRWRNEKEIQEVFANLKAGKYASLRDLAEKNYRHGLWASWFVDVIVAERKLLTLEEFAACLTSPRAQKMLLARHKLPVPPPPPPTPEHTVKPKRKRGGDRFDEEKWMAKLQKVCPKIAKKIMEEEESSTL